MNENHIQSSVHPKEYSQTLKKGLPWGILGIVIGLLGQMWLKPDPFSLIGLLAFGATIGCLVVGFHRYIKLKLSDRFPTFVEWDNKYIYILGLEKEELKIPFTDIGECVYIDGRITIRLKNGPKIILNHFSDRAAIKLKSALNA